MLLAKFSGLNHRTWVGAEIVGHYQFNILADILLDVLCQRTDLASSVWLFISSE